MKYPNWLNYFTEATTETERVQRVQKVAKFLDSQFQVGGVRVGYDSIVGLIPGAGDLITGLAGLYIVYEGYRLGLPKPLLQQMVFRLVVDIAVGSIPLIGDIFDVLFKANKRNAEKLIKHVSYGTT